MAAPFEGEAEVALLRGRMRAVFLTPPALARARASTSAPIRHQGRGFRALPLSMRGASATTAVESAAIRAKRHSG